MHALKMLKLLISLAVCVPLLLLLILRVDAGVQGTLTSVGGHECNWRVKSRNNDKRDLRLDCKCKDNEGMTSVTHATTYPIISSVVRIKQNLVIIIMIMLLLTIVKQLTN